MWRAIFTSLSPATPHAHSFRNYDPVTPPEYGEEALAQFSNSRHLVGTGLGHIVSTDPCFGRIIAQFIAGTELDELDVACIERLGPSPFFINLLGPTP
jgi:pimeloyl-ACP methyl ester carboxylesterase